MLFPQLEKKYLKKNKLYEAYKKFIGKTSKKAVQRRLITKEDPRSPVLKHIVV